MSVVQRSRRPSARPARVRLVATVVAVSLAVGQADQRSQDDDFKKLRAFTGTWEAKDVEAVGGVGDVVVSWKPMLNGKFIEQRYVFKGQGVEPLLHGVIVIGRDPADDVVRSWWFDSKGGVATSVLTSWDGNKSNWSTTFLNTDGTQEKSDENYLTVRDKDSYVWVLAITGGDKTGAVFNRVRPKKSEWPDPQYDTPIGLAGPLKDMAWWAGKYAANSVNAFTEKPTTGYSNCGWILNGKFLQFDSASLDSDLDLMRYRALIGVDPATGKLTGWEFNSAGTVGKYTVSNEGQDIVGKALSPDAGLLEYKGKMTKTEDGLKYEASGDLDGESKTIYGGILKRLK